MNTFEVLTLFLEGCGPIEVEGRAMEIPPDDLAAKLKAFAAGTLSPPERANVVETLKEHPHWISQVAREARLLRHDDVQVDSLEP